MYLRSIKDVSEKYWKYFQNELKNYWILYKYVSQSIRRLSILLDTCPKLILLHFWSIWASYATSNYDCGVLSRGITVFMSMGVWWTSCDLYPCCCHVQFLIQRFQQRVVIPSDQELVFSSPYFDFLPVVILPRIWCLFPFSFTIIFIPLHFFKTFSLSMIFIPFLSSSCLHFSCDCLQCFWFAAASLPFFVYYK